MVMNYTLERQWKNKRHGFTARIRLYSRSKPDLTTVFLERPDIKLKTVCYSYPDCKFCKANEDSYYFKDEHDRANTFWKEFTQAHRTK